eukprot:360328-Chlamydomonas_euryale.AAC.19
MLLMAGAPMGPGQQPVHRHAQGPQISGVGVALQPLRLHAGLRLARHRPDCVGRAGRDGAVQTAWTQGSGAQATAAPCLCALAFACATAYAFACACAFVAARSLTEVLQGHSRVREDG